MTREEARKAAEIMLAYADGAEIEWKDREEDSDYAFWHIDEQYPEPIFEWYTSDYRVKPKTTYRPFSSAEEAFNEAKMHGFWVDRGENAFDMITSINQGDSSVLLSDLYYSFAELLNFKWADDKTPCGIKNED